MGALILLFPTAPEISLGNIPVVIAAGPGLIYTEAPIGTSSVGDLLSRFNIPTESALVSPSLDTPLAPHMQISVKPIFTLLIYDGAKAPVALETSALSIGTALLAAGFHMGEYDTVTPDPIHPPSEDLIVTITRVVKEEHTESVVIKHSTIYVDDPERLWGSEALLTAGSDGLAEEHVLLQYINGELVARSVLHRDIIRSPSAAQVRRGTKIVVDRVQEGGGSWYRYKNCDCAAHNEYPRGTWLRVTSLLDGRQEIVKTNDWGPDPAVHPDRVIDLDATVFIRFAPLWTGLIPVRVERLVTE